jgi:tRNA(fMet)-specific endonuclease VapC
MGTLIDSSVLIAGERGQFDLTTTLIARADEQLAISAITATELLHGLYRAKTATQRTRREAFMEGLLAKLPVIPFDLVAARIHAQVWAQLAAKGITVGPHDLLIAATALATSATVATRDERSFPHIPGLTVVRW